MRVWMGAALVILCAAAGPAAADRLVLRGDMTRLDVTGGPAVAGEVETAEGARSALADHLGARLTVLNFWASWCAPCREEMPTLEALAADPPEGVAVIALSTGRDSGAAIRAFREDEGIEALADLREPSGAIGRAARLRSLPTTLILGPGGEEVARLSGTADWNAPEARAALSALSGAD